MFDDSRLVRFLQYHGNCTAPISTTKLVQRFGEVRNEVYDRNGQILKELSADLVTLEYSKRRWEVPRNTTNLTIQDRMIEDIDPAITELQDLVSLRLDRNDLTTLPATLSKLTDLDTLSLSVNWFESPPDVIYDIPSLTYLDISYNPLTQLAPALSQLRGLLHLELSHCPMAVLPAAVYELPHLRYLDICHTQIADISLDPVFISRLKILRCQGSPLYKRMTKTGIVDPSQVQWCWDTRYMHNILLYMCLSLNCNVVVLESLKHAMSHALPYCM